LNKWSNFLLKYIQSHFFLSGFIRRVKQAQNLTFGLQLLKKIPKYWKISIFLAFFSTFFAYFDFAPPSTLIEHALLVVAWKNILRFGLFRNSLKSSSEKFWNLLEKWSKNFLVRLGRSWRAEIWHDWICFACSNFKLHTQIWNF
jgi:hypothetical protein